MAAPRRSTAAARGASVKSAAGGKGESDKPTPVMAPQAAAVKVAPAAPPAVAQPDPATLSARDRIRLHVQKNLQMQQQQALQQQQQQAAGVARGGAKGGGVEASQAKAGPSRKRPYDDTRSSGDGSPTWETNTPPSGLSVDEQGSPNKVRRGLDDGSFGGSDGEDADDFGDTHEGMPSPSAQQGLDSSLNMSLEMNRSGMYQPHNDEDGHAHERVGAVGSPAGEEEAPSRFDSPPCEVAPPPFPPFRCFRRPLAHALRIACCLSLSLGAAYCVILCLLHERLLLFVGLCISLCWTLCSLCGTLSSVLLCLLFVQLSLVCLLGFDSSLDVAIKL